MVPKFSGQQARVSPESLAEESGLESLSFRTLLSIGYYYQQLFDETESHPWNMLRATAQTGSRASYQQLEKSKRHGRVYPGVFTLFERKIATLV